MSELAYCTICDARLIVHADGTIACECGDVWRLGDDIPAGWPCTEADLDEMGARERAF